MKKILFLFLLFYCAFTNAQIHPSQRYFFQQAAIPKTDTVTTPDADATAFLTATGITDATITKAVNRLVLDLKGTKNALYYTTNLWDSLKAIYPFVGGTATTHKFNLKDPRDLDAAFRLTFSGAANTHTSDGIVTGASGYADPHMYLNPNLNYNSLSMGLYFTTDAVTNGNNYCIGLRNSAAEQYILVKYTDSKAYLYITPGVGSPVSCADSRGFYAQGYGSSGKTSCFKGHIYTSSAGIFPYDALDKLALGGWGLYTSGGAIISAHTKQTFGFAFFSAYLDKDKMIAMFNAVQQFETTLGRAVNN